MECVPRNLYGKEALSYLAQIIATYKIDFNDFRSKLPGRIDIDVLMEVPKDVHDAERIIAAKSQSLRMLAEISHKIGFHIPPEVLTNLKRYEFFKACLSNGIEIKGSEPIDYDIRNTKMSNRNQAMIEVLLQEEQMGKAVFFNVGASHGIELIEELCARSCMTNAFVRLFVDATTYKEESTFCQWQSGNANLDLGYGNKLQTLNVPSFWPQERQDQLFRSQYTPFVGPRGLPENIRHNIYTGQKEYLKRQVLTKNVCSI